MSMYWLRTSIMIAMLVVVIWSMRKLNSPGGGIPDEAAPAAEAMALCPTRITWIETGGIHLEEHKTKWMLTVNGGPMQELDGPETEKWFSRFCSSALKEDKSNAADFKPLVKLGYVSGSNREILRGTDNRYQFEGLTYVSPDLDEALRTLPSLPAAAKPSNP